MLSLNRLSRCTLGRCLRSNTASSQTAARLTLSNHYQRYNSSSANGETSSLSDVFGTLAVPIGAHGNIKGFSNKRSQPTPPNRARSASETNSSPTPRRPPPPVRRLNARQRRAQLQRQATAKVTSKGKVRIQTSKGRSQKKQETSASADPAAGSETLVEYDPKVIEGTSYPSVSLPSLTKWIEVVGSTSQEDTPPPPADETLATGSIEAGDVKIEGTIYISHLHRLNDT